VELDLLLKIVPIIKERITTLDEAVDMAGFFFKDDVDYEPRELVGKGLDVESTKKILWECYDILCGVESMNLASTEPRMRNYVENSGLSAGQVFGVLRVAVTGQRVSPPLFESMEIIGKEKVIERIKKAIDLL